MFTKGHKTNIGKKNTLGKRWKLSDEAKKNMSLASKGKPKSIQHRKSLSIAQTGTKKPWVSKAHKGKTVWNKGTKGHQVSWLKGLKKETDIRIKSISERMSGNNNPQWRGGISKQPYAVDWTETLKRSIRERDYYICQICNQYGSDVHHIDYNKQNCNVSNLITLCRSCHMKTNFGRDNWKEYFKNKHL